MLIVWELLESNFPRKTMQCTCVSSLFSSTNYFSLSFWHPSLLFSSSHVTASCQVWQENKLIVPFLKEYYILWQLSMQPVRHIYLIIIIHNIHAVLVYNYHNLLFFWRVIINCILHYCVGWGPPLSLLGHNESLHCNTVQWLLRAKNI